MARSLGTVHGQRLAGRMYAFRPVRNFRAGMTGRSLLASIQNPNKEDSK
ncbi:hypothetical protein C7S14_4503 [Burkholderia cepacia]|nr:hypothetical protein C7S14_4503 [Burkholderia cepacia]